jgi:CRP-like cAMP-binding protein
MSLDDDDVRARLRSRYHELRPITDADWAKLAPHVRAVTLEPGRRFLSAGEVSDKCALLLSGLMRAYYETDDGRQAVSAFRAEGAFVCVYESFLTRRPSRLTIEAMQPCVLAEFDLAPYRELVVTDPYWCHIGRLLIERRYIEQEERIYETLACDVRARWELLQMRQRARRLPLSQRHLASYLGVARETVNRLARRGREGGG